MARSQIWGCVVYSVLKPLASAGGPLTVIPITLETDTATPAESTLAATVEATNLPAVTPGNTSAAECESVIYRVSHIQIDARTLVTDNIFRNRAIRNQILDTNNEENPRRG